MSVHEGISELAVQRCAAMDRTFNFRSAYCRMYKAMANADAAGRELADRAMAVAAQTISVAKADAALDLAVMKARDIYVDDADTAADPCVFAAAKRLLGEKDALRALQRDRDIARVAQLLWTHEAKVLRAR